MLSREETQSLLILAVRGDEQAQERLIAENLALVRSVVRRFANRGAEYDDLYQLGCVGLVKAIQHFDPSYNVQFSTYAVPMIAGEIKRFLRDDGQVKIGRSLKELAAKALAVRDRLSGELGTPPGIAQIAEELHVSPEDIALALDASRPTLSLNEPLGDGEDGHTREDTLAAPAREDLLVDRMLIRDLLSELDERERLIIVLRYFRDCTQTQVARLLGVSQVQVSRLENRILKKLRLHVNEKRPSQ
ncbi:MAG: SigB/SigF/SigG family RNA polymerase sigma factor [Clostridia bacterium]